MEGLFQQGWLTGLFLLMFSSFSLASELAYAPPWTPQVDDGDRQDG